VNTNNFLNLVKPDMRTSNLYRVEKGD